jgi:hypothetical protein
MAERLTIAESRKLREVLIEYLKAKAEAEDWHAVSDAACDLRELDAVLAERLEPS